MMAHLQWYLDPSSPYQLHVKKNNKKTPSKLAPSDKTFWLRACSRCVIVLHVSLVVWSDLTLTSSVKALVRLRIYTDSLLTDLINIEISLHRISETPYNGTEPLCANKLQQFLKDDCHIVIYSHVI